MKKVLLLLFITLVSCNKSVSVEEDIENVINCVAFDKKLNYHPNIPLLDTLSKLTISASDSNFSPHSGIIKIKRLMEFEINKEKVFNSNDSLHFFKQNNTHKNFQLKNKKYGNLQTINSSDYNKSELYFMTIPLFSSNHKYSYVATTHSIPKFGGSAYYYLLEKVNGKWKIIKTDLIWLS